MFILLLNNMAAVRKDGDLNANNMSHGGTVELYII
jgi:hypothetical protein